MSTVWKGRRVMVSSVEELAYAAESVDVPPTFPTAAPRLVQPPAPFLITPLSRS